MNQIIYIFLKIPLVRRYTARYVRKRFNRFTKYYKWSATKLTIEKSHNPEFETHSKGLLDKGFINVQGLFSDSDFIVKVNDLVANLSDSFEESKKLLQGSEWRYMDTENDVEYWYSTIDKSGDRYGRVRFFFQPESKHVQDGILTYIHENELVKNLGEQTYGIGTKPYGYMIEILSPSLDSDGWHIDNCFDKMKAMILLTDVTEKNGPMRYKEGTHKVNDFLSQKTVFESATLGLDYGYPPFTLVEKMKEKEIKAVGNAGDCVFFNTLGIHSGSRCIEGQRTALVVYYSTVTSKNTVLHNLVN